MSLALDVPRKEESRMRSQCGCARINLSEITFRVLIESVSCWR